MIEREIFIIKEEDSVCLGQKFSKPTQMFSVSVFEIFLDTKNKFYISFFWSTNFVLLLLFLGTRGIEEKKKTSSNTSHKGQIKFSLSLCLFIFFKYHKIFFHLHVNFYVRLFSMFSSFSFLILGFFSVQQIKTRHQPPWTRE